MSTSWAHLLSLLTKSTTFPCNCTSAVFWRLGCQDRGKFPCLSRFSGESWKFAGRAFPRITGYFTEEVWLHTQTVSGFYRKTSYIYIFMWIQVNSAPFCWWAACRMTPAHQIIFYLSDPKCHQIYPMSRSCSLERLCVAFAKFISQRIKRMSLICTALSLIALITRIPRHKKFCDEKWVIAF